MKLFFPVVLLLCFFLVGLSACVDVKDNAADQAPSVKTKSSTNNTSQDQTTTDIAETSHTASSGNFDEFFYLTPTDKEYGVNFGLGKVTVAENPTFYGAKRDYVIAFIPPVNIADVALNNLTQADEAKLMKAGKVCKLKNGQQIYALGKRQLCGDIRLDEFKIIGTNKRVLAPPCFFKSYSTPGPQLEQFKGAFNKNIKDLGHPAWQIGNWKGDPDYSTPPMILWYWNFLEPSLAMTADHGNDVTVTTHSVSGKIVSSIDIETIGMETEAVQQDCLDTCRSAMIRALYPKLDDLGRQYLIQKIGTADENNPICDIQGRNLIQVGNHIQFSCGF